LLFPSLAAQGATLNRAAALVEKAGLPRDRLLDGVELAAAIARSGDTPETWYLGHDYRSADLARFFALAERDRVALTEAELWLREQFVTALALAGSGPFAFVSVPIRAGSWMRRCARRAATRDRPRPLLHPARLRRACAGGLAERLHRRGARRLSRLPSAARATTPAMRS
jgi:hypothetical protein